MSDAVKFQAAVQPDDQYSSIGENNDLHRLAAMSFDSRHPIDSYSKYCCYY